MLPKRTFAHIPVKITLLLAGGAIAVASFAGAPASGAARQPGDPARAEQQASLARAVPARAIALVADIAPAQPPKSAAKAAKSAGKAAKSAGKLASPVDKPAKRAGQPVTQPRPRQHGHRHHGHRPHRRNQHRQHRYRKLRHRSSTVAGTITGTLRGTGSTGCRTGRS